MDNIKYSLVFKGYKQFILFPIFSKKKYEKKINILKFKVKNVNLIIKEKTIDKNIFIDGEKKNKGCIKLLKNDLNLQLKDQFEYLGESISIFGLIKLNNSYFLISISSANQIGHILGNNIYSIRKFNYYFITNLSANNYLNEKNIIKNLLKFLNNEKEFIFSDNYDITNNFQNQVLVNKNHKFDFGRLEFKFNYFLIKEFILISNGLTLKWYKNCIYGFYDFKKIKINTYYFSFHLIARKESNNPGTRYNRRGINSNGFCSNFVECEQIVINESLSNKFSPKFSSFTQIRGSIPLFWKQIPKLLIPTPLIQITDNLKEPIGIKVHMIDLFKRYGGNIYILNLVKQNIVESDKKHENNLGEAFKKMFDAMNLNNCFFEWWDFKNLIKTDQDFSSYLIQNLVKNLIDNNKFFIYNGDFKEYQKGIVRINCVDCLDRTNLAASLISILILKNQIYYLSQNKIDNIKFNSKFDFNENIQKEIFNLWSNLGDYLGLQYGGSKAHSINNNINTKILISIKRHINNSFFDLKKQFFLDIILHKIKTLDFEDFKNQTKLIQKENLSIINIYNKYKNISKIIENYNIYFSNSTIELSFILQKIYYLKYNKTKEIILNIKNISEKEISKDITKKIPQIKNNDNKSNYSNLKNKNNNFLENIEIKDFDYNLKNFNREDYDGEKIFDEIFEINNSNIEFDNKTYTEETDIYKEFEDCDNLYDNYDTNINTNELDKFINFDDKLTDKFKINKSKKKNSIMINFFKNDRNEII